MATKLIAPTGTLSIENEPSSLVMLRIIGGASIIIPPPLRDVDTPTWNCVTGLCVDLSTMRPLTVVPAGSSMTTSFAGAVSER